MDRLAKWMIIIIPVAYALMKVLFTYRWWFEGVDFWNAAFQPFPSETYGYLLGAKWIGTRNLMHGAVILLALVMARHQVVAWMLLIGVMVEFFDGFWLAYGKFVAGWQGPNTDFYMIGAFVWLPFLAWAGVRYLRKS